MTAHTFIPISILFAVSLLFKSYGFAQASKLECANQPSATSSCALKKNQTKKTVTASSEIEKECQKNTYSPEFALAFESFEKWNHGGDPKEYIEAYQESITEQKLYLKKLEKLSKEFKNKPLSKNAVIKKKLKVLTEEYSEAMISKDYEKMKIKVNEYHVQANLLQPEEGYLDFSSKEEILEQIQETKSNLKQMQIALDKVKKSLGKSKDKKPDQKIDLQEFAEKYQDLIDSVKSRKQFTDCGLTNQEILAITSYSGNAYAEINAALRSQDKEQLAKLKPVIDAMNSGMSKLANYKDLVKRGADLPEAIEKKHCLGCIVNYPAFTSTSTTTGFGGKHIFIIQSKTGRYIAPLSQSSGEEEVLFKDDSRFKILNIEKNGYSTVFTMVEVSKGDDPDKITEAKSPTGKKMNVEKKPEAGPYYGYPHNVVPNNQSKDPYSKQIEKDIEKEIEKDFENKYENE